MHEAGRPVAIDLGCGRGREAGLLAEHGYAVHAYDVDCSVTPEMAELASEHPVQHRIVDLAEVAELPSADLVLSCASASFAGLKHWHSYQAIARQPGVGPAPQDGLSA